MAQAPKNAVRASLIAVTLVAAGAGTARAQTHRPIEVSGSYQEAPDASLAASAMGRNSRARGWTADVAIPLSPLLSIVGIIDGASGRGVSPDAFPGSGDIRSAWTDTGYFGGVRWDVPRPWRVSPFAQVLGGVVRARTTVEYGIDRPRTYHFSDELFLGDIGGGVNLMITRRLGVRVGADLRIDPLGVALDSYDTTMGRAYAGLVVKLR